MTLLPTSLPALMPALITAPIGWRMYKRIRRLIGRQPVRVGRLVLTAIFFPVVMAFVSLAGLRDILLAEGLAAGVVVGIVLGWVGLRLTRFEVTPEGHFFVPNRVIGLMAGYYTAFAIGVLVWYRRSRYVGIAPSATVEPPAL